MEPPNDGHIGDKSLVLCRDVVPITRRLALSKFTLRPCYDCLASSPGFPVWMRLHAAQTMLLAIFWEAQHGNGEHVYKCASHRESVHSRRLYIQLRSFWSPSVFVVQSREVVHISEVGNALDVC